MERSQENALRAMRKQYTQIMAEEDARKGRVITGAYRGMENREFTMQGIKLVHNVRGEVLLHELENSEIYVSTGSACNSKDTKISHVLKAISLDDKYARGTIRVSLGKNNTLEDVERIVIGLKKILK